MEILNNLNSLKKNVLREGLTRNFMPLKFKETLAEKMRKKFYFNKTVTVHMSCLFKIIFC